MWSSRMNRSGVLRLLRNHNMGQKYSFHTLKNAKHSVLYKYNAFSSYKIENLSAACIAFVRHNSNAGENLQNQPVLDINSDKENLTEELFSKLPDLPIEYTNETTEKLLNVLGEETLQSAGLGSWTPAGLVQNALQLVHVTFDMPWWLTIVAGTVVLRLLMFPLVIASQRHSVKMNNHLPHIQAYQQKITECRLQGNPYEMAKMSQEFMLYMKKHQVNPLKGMVLPLVQLPIFLSMFLGLRGMAMLPLESLTYGGLHWFSDLSIPDPYFVLPIITSVTLAITLEFGVDVNKLNSTIGFGKFIKRGFRVLPFIVFPFIMNFPAAVCLYWASTNFITLGQVMFLKIPEVRQYFNIEEDMKVVKPILQKGFVDDFKDSWKNIQIVNELEEREYLDRMKSSQIGKGPIKTFKYNTDTNVLEPLKKEK